MHEDGYSPAAPISVLVPHLILVPLTILVTRWRLDGDTVTINLDRIDENATITLTYHLRGQDNNDIDDEVAGDGVDDAASLIESFWYWLTLDAAVHDMMVSAFEIETVVPTAAAGAADATYYCRDIDYRR